MEHVIRFARKANVGTVALFHHDPYHTDDELDRLFEAARRHWAEAGIRVWLACEGMSVVFDENGPHVTD
jgi:hypothetical protein